MATKLFKLLSGDTYKRIIVQDPAPYLADGWSLTPAKPEEPKKEAKKATRKKKD